MNENFKCEDGLFEKQIIELLRQGKTGKEIMDRLKDPAVFQAFSPSRENILNWYPFKKEDVVLEVGAGMGAVTGLLCRKCKRVVALEISSQHADICRMRHREYNNLEVVSESSDDFNTEERFDYVIAVGLPERAVDSPNAADQYVKLLSSVRKKLKPTGVLLLAADNRFGARYWCALRKIILVFRLKVLRAILMINKANILTVVKRLTDRLCLILLRKPGLHIIAIIIRCRIINSARLYSRIQYCQKSKM